MTGQRVRAGANQIQLPTREKLARQIFAFSLHSLSMQCSAWSERSLERSRIGCLRAVAEFLRRKRAPSCHQQANLQSKHRSRDNRHQILGINIRNVVEGKQVISSPHLACT